MIPFFLLGGFLWLASQEWTLQWIAQKVVQAGGGRVEVEGVSGTLVNSFEIEKIVFTSREKDIEINDLKVAWNPWRLLHGQLDIDLLSVGSLGVDLKMSSDEPFVLPQSLAPPVSVEVAGVILESVSVSKAGVGITLENVHFAISSDATAWHLKNLGFDSPFGNAAINVDLGTARPFAIDGTVQFDNELMKARANMMLNGDLDRLGVSGSLDGYGATGKLDARVTPFASFPFESVWLEAKGIDPSKMESGWPVANVDAQIDINAEKDKSLKGSVSIHNGKPGPFDRNALPVYFVNAKISGSIERIHLNDLLLNFGKAGQFRGNGLVSSEKTDITLETSRFDLHKITSRIRQTHIAGKIGFHQTGTDQEFTVALGEDHIRLNAHLLKKGDALVLEDMLLKADQSALRMTGRMSLEEQQDFRFEGEASRFNFASFGRFPESGLNVGFDVSGRLKPERDILVHYSFLPSRLFNQDLSGKGQFRIGDKEVRDARILLTLGANTVNVDGNLGKRGDRLVWELKAPDLDSFGKGYKGALFGKGELFGSLKALRGRMNLAGGDFMLMDRYGARKMQANVQFGTEWQDRIEVDVQLDDAVFGSGKWKAIQAQIDGTLRSHTIKASARNDSFDLTAGASGGLSSNGIWQGKLETLENRGKLAFSLDASVPVKIGKDDVSLGNLTLKLPDGQLTVEKLVKKGTLLETSGNARGVPLAYLLAVTQDSKNTVHSTLTLGADWSVKANRSLDGNLRIYRERGDVTLVGDNIIKLGLKTFDIQAVLSRNTVNLNAKIESDKAGDIQAQAMTGLVLHNGSWSLSKDSPFKMTVQANVPSLSWIGPLTGQPDMQLGGSVTLQISGNGTLGDPRLSGSVNGKDLAVNWLSMGVDLSKGELSAVLDGNRLQIRKGIIYGPEGNLQISGGLQMKNGQLLTSLYFKTDKLLILSNVDRQLAITGQGQFSLDENRLQLLGEWQVNRAMIILSDSRNVTYSKDVVVLGRPEKKTGESVPVSFNLKIDLGNQFYLKGKGLDTRLAGQIQAVSSRDNKLRVFGTVNTVDGSYSAFGQKLAIKKGQVTFSGPVENPTLDILAGRDFPPSDDVTEVGVSVTGTAQSPKVKLVSTPEVSDTEKLSWLVLGYGGGENGDDQQRALIATAAAAILSTEQSGGFPTKLASTIGLDDIGISSSSELDETVLSLTKRISSRLYLTYEQGLTGATNLIKLRYIISRRLSLVGQTGTITAVDLLYDWKFD
ncbi:translocation/assembly module TamB domain-containing protein [Oxalobacter paraformigenes]|uniref:translocation/assembly module TamB domain-containing protein n=1 Tax=Oxalobacter paraformigenes TaxID=556268 RepID=UPI00030C1922|nr:translocation/assembly module TamB domain-containing protein [Oxalobacter paraformigenes]